MRLTQQQLEAHLWGAANILRGKTAGQDYKNYILSLTAGVAGDDFHLGQPRTPVTRTAPKVGWNDPCPCGSGKKYKKCCGASGGSPSLH